MRCLVLGSSGFIGHHLSQSIIRNTDWEIYLSDASGAHTRVTRDIQHDILPRFLTNTTLLGMMGEPRHRRSQVYDLTAGTRTRVFSSCDRAWSIV